jgi:cytochrome P450/NADPH-cytochrome P450 reductase
MGTTQALDSIPFPPPHFLLGNAPDLGRAAPVQSLMRLARRHGPIFRLKLPGRSPIVVSGFSLVDEVCSDKRFDKRVGGAVAKLRPLGGDGLFTAHTEEPNWRKAHNILLSAFSLPSMHVYFPIMTEIADQLAAKWESQGQGTGLDVAADMTRLTLDTIARCGFDYHYDSLSSREQHPFVASMVRALQEGQERAQRLWIEEWLSVGKHRRFNADLAFLFSTVDRVIQERRGRTGSTAKPDLLELMLRGVDKSSGERLDDVNIRHQIITFLIAGHETTSGLLSFALYFLLRNPQAMARARAEVGSVIGPGADGLTEFEQVTRLRYIGQVLKEALRLWPTAPAFTRHPRENTVLGGRYAVGEEESILVLTAMLHRDPSVWGENAETFDPDHFSPEAEQKRPANAFLPFGVGQRSCIGRFFALQEASIVLATVLHRLSLSGDPAYTLRVKETLTLKPEGFLVRGTPLARGRDPAPADQVSPGVRAGRAAPPLLILYGSNMGTSEELARQLARDADSNGYEVEISPLDDCPAQVPRAGALLIVTASYNGNPPDNAVRFGSRLADGTGAFAGVKYAVFGCGHHDWAATFQAFPSFIDTRLEAAGAVRVLEKGGGDSGGDLFGDFRVWRRSLWEKLPAALGVEIAPTVSPARAPLYGVQVVNEQQPNPFVVSFAARQMVIVENRELQRDGRRSTRHIELALPEGVSYRPGDHLGVIARNHRDTVRRVLARFGYDEDTVVRLQQQGRARTTLPVDRAISVSALLTDYVELQDVATQDQIALLAEHTQSPSDRTGLAALCGEGDDARRRYQEEILHPRVSLIDLLEEYPTCALPFGSFLGMLSPLRPRYFSISSSPLELRGICSITVGVVDEPARSGRGRFRGVCSNYLASKVKGSSVHAFVRDPGTPFRPPRNPRTPVIMVGAGTGVAPFIGFLQERAWLAAQDYSIGPALLFFGCRHPDVDFYYSDVLEEYARRRVVEIVCAFSRQDPAQKVYVQDRIRERRDQVWDLLQEGAVVYVCGDAARIAPGVRAAFGDVCQEKTGCDSARKEEWLNELAARQRYLTDVWASK